VTLFAVGLTATIGMWFERYMLLVTTLFRDYLVSSWGHFFPSVWEWTLFFGSIGLFLTLFLLFVRWLPMLSAFEIKEATFEEEEADAEAAHG
jgi:molybdopterin-containing oxidoreductase family membrane subunit